MAHRYPNFLYYGGTGIFVIKYPDKRVFIAPGMKVNQIKECMANGLEVYWCDQGMGIFNLEMVISGKRSSTSATLITERILNRCIEEINSGSLYDEKFDNPSNQSERKHKKVVRKR